MQDSPLLSLTMHYNGGGVSGEGIILKLAKNHPYKIWRGCDRDTNTKSELLAFCGIVYFVASRGIVYFFIVEDSKVIFYWVDYKCQLQVLSLHK